MSLLLTSELPECQSTLWLATVGGAVLGTTITILCLVITASVLLSFHPPTNFDNLSRLLLSSPALAYAEDKRSRLPKTIILIRHGESEANADKDLWKKVPDNLLGLTDEGRNQAKAAGKRVEYLLDLQNHSRVHLVVSPFERTLQTASCLRGAFEHRIVRTDIESRIREQEVGNMQGEEFQLFRHQQQKVGRFWYRFRDGESGADVLDRVKSWWYESVSTVNLRAGYRTIDAMVVVSHGLTMRFILMQLFGWSPTTFHSVWNVDNCGMYVLQKDLNKPGPSPYVLDKDRGDMPRSSIDVVVKLKSSGKEIPLKLEDYLSIPPPRTTRINVVKRMLAAQYPNELVHGANDIASILLMPFVVEGDDDDGVVLLGRSGVAESTNSDFQQKSQQKPTVTTTTNDGHFDVVDPKKRGSSVSFSSNRWEHCQFNASVSCNSDVSESDDRLCNCCCNNIGTKANAVATNEVDGFSTTPTR